MDPLNINKYKVPLIPSGLRHEETIVQTANALEYLNNVVNDIFDKINNRINKNNAKINEIQGRIKTACDKINNLAGTKKAICIYSPSKFPGLDILKDIPTTFNDEVFLNINFKLNTDYQIESGLEPLTQNSLQDKLEFFHVREISEPTRVSKIKSVSGLGPLPIGLKSVNSLLLYNTSENVYFDEKDKQILYKQVSQMPINEEKISKEKLLEAAPISITSRPEKKVQQKLFYTPRLNNAPDINLPLDLPDLPGIANDIQFEIDNSKQIKVTPSSSKSEIKSEIVKERKIKKENKVSEEKIVKKEEKSSTITTDSSEDKQQSKDIQEDKLPETSSIKEIPVITSTSPTPPPPPPPPVVQLPKITEQTNTKSSKPSKKVDTSDVRSNLMEAIRKAGGARGGKLRAAADVVNNPSQNQNNDTSKNTSGNLMDDLHKKLLMRRKGISGTKENEKSGNVFDKLSSLIPPPPKPSENVYSSTSDNDNDNDDWD